jgi:hypothetical protein
MNEVTVTRRIFQTDGPRPYRGTSWVALVWDMSTEDGGGPRREILAHLCARDETTVAAMLDAVTLKLKQDGWAWRETAKGADT